MAGKRIVVTGGAGFIGSNLTQALLADDRVEKVLVIDDLSNGYKQNVAPFQNHPKFEFVEEDIRNAARIEALTKGYHAISHQAALGSVPRSIQNPVLTNDVNLGGTVNVLNAAVKNNMDRVVLAGSSSTYGDSVELPKKEDRIGKPLSPYAVTKYAIEVYADVFQRTYGLNFITLRYFNVFGPKQSPDNPYAAVIPLFCKAFLEGRQPVIFGDGSNSRDFTYVENVVQANMLALFTTNDAALNQVYNIGCGEQTSLKTLVSLLREISGKPLEGSFNASREGDVKHSQAEILKAQSLLGYKPTVLFREGLSKTYRYYQANVTG